MGVATLYESRLHTSLMSAEHSVFPARDALQARVRDVDDRKIGDGYEDVFGPDYTTLILWAAVD